jgi:hypothetical protein
MDTSLTDADVADQVAAVLTKPFGLDELASTVRNVLAAVVASSHSGDDGGTG